MIFLKEYAIAVCGAVVLGVVCEMILPDGDIKKYIRLCLGFVLVFVIIRPFSGISPKEVFSINLTFDDNAALFNTEHAEGIQRNQIVRLYKKRMGDEMKSAIQKTTNLYEVDVKIEVESEEETEYGKITSVLVMLTPKGGGSNEVDFLNMDREIKSLFKDIYDVPNDKVRIKVLDF